MRSAEKTVGGAADVDVVRMDRFIVDVHSLSLLSSLETRPRLVLLPPFNASSTADYYATAPHRVVVVQIRGLAAHCSADTRLVDRHGPSR